MQYGQELYLGKNKITTMEGMEQLTELKILSIQVSMYQIQYDMLPNMAGMYFIRTKH